MEFLEFTEDIAILQSSFQLALQVAGGTLLQVFDINNQSHCHALSIITEAAQEIRCGLMHPRNSTEMKSIDNILVGTLVVKHLQQEGRATTELCTRYESLTYGIPPLHMSFIVELIIKCEWILTFIKVIEREVLKTEVKVDIALNVLDKASTSEVSSSLAQVLYSLEYLLLEKNSILHRSNVHECPCFSSDICLDILKRLLCLSNEKGFHHIILHCLLSLALGILHKKVSVLNKKLVEVNLKSCADDSKLTIHDLVNLGRLSAPIESVFSGITVSTKESLNDSLIPLLFDMCKSVEFNDNSISHMTENSSLRERLIIYGVDIIFVRNIESFRKGIMNNDIHEHLLQTMWQQIDSTLKRLEKTTKAKIIESKENKEQYLLDKAIYAVSNKSTNKYWIEWMAVIDNEDILSDPRWSNCLKTNGKSFRQEHLVWMLMQKLPIFKGENRISVQNIILNIYRCLETSSIGRILNMLSSCEEEIILENPATFMMQSTDVFNRLGNHNNPADIVGDIASLAAQSPLKTQRKMVIEAIYNKPLTHRIVEIFKLLPGLLLLTETDKFTMTVILEREVFKSKMTRAEWQNCLLFVSKLFEETRCCDEPAQQNEKTEGVIKELIEYVLLPRLDMNRPQESISSLELVLAILGPINREFNKTNKSAARVLLSCDSEGCLLVFLIACVNQIDSNGTDADYVMLLELKGLANRVLEILVTFIASSDIRYNRSSWFYRCTTLFDWTVVIQLNSIMDSDVSRKIPDNLLELLDTNDSSLESFESRLPTIFNLLEFARITNLSEKSLHWAKLSIVPHLRAHIVLHLCQILPDATAEEWIRIGAFLYNVITQGSVSLSIISEKPATSVCSIMIDSMLLLIEQDVNNPCFSFPFKWLNMSNNLVATLMKLINDAVPPVRQCLYEVFQSAAQLCCIRTENHTYNVDAIGVLVLDLLSRYEACVTSPASTNDTEQNIVNAEIEHMYETIESFPELSVKKPLDLKLSKIREKKSTTLY